MASLSQRLRAFLEGPQGRKLIESGRRQLAKPQNQQRVRRVLDNPKNQQRLRSLANRLQGRR